MINMNKAKKIIKKIDITVFTISIIPTCGMLLYLAMYAFGAHESFTFLLYPAFTVAIISTLFG